MHYYGVIYQALISTLTGMYMYILLSVYCIVNFSYIYFESIFVDIQQTEHKMLTLKVRMMQI